MRQSLRPRLYTDSYREIIELRTFDRASFTAYTNTASALQSPAIIGLCINERKNRLVQMQLNQTQLVEDVPCCSQIDAISLLFT